MRARLAVAVALLAAAAAVPAGAEPPPQYAGGCFLAAAAQTTEVAGTPPNQNDGLYGAAVAAVDPTAGRNPVHIDVRCDLKVNGTLVRSLVVSGEGVAAWAAPMAFTAEPADVVTLCTTVTPAGGTAATDCRSAVGMTVVPDGILDALCDIPPAPLVCDVLYANRAHLLVVLPPPL